MDNNNEPSNLDQNNYSSGQDPSQIPTENNSETLPVETPEQNDRNLINSSSSKIIYFFIFIILLLTILSAAYFYFFNDQDTSVDPDITNLPGGAQEFQMAKFASDDEFKEYFASAQSSGFFGVDMLRLDIPSSAVDLGPQGQFGSLESRESVDRFSGTNIQVGSIDEPDILKTDGENIYFSGNNSFIRPFVGSGRSIWSTELEAEQTTKVVQVFPPQNIQNRSEINEKGEMLLSGNNLVIFANNQIVGYNVSDKANPSRTWNIDLIQGNEAMTRVLTSRLYQNKIYVVTNTFVWGDLPCPIPLSTGVTAITVSCVDVFRPGLNVNPDSTYTIMRIDPSNGAVEDSISFVGSTQESVVYMSENSIFVTNTNRVDEMEIFSDFFVLELDDLLPQELRDRIKQISEYDISSQAKMMEYQLSLMKYYETMSEEEQEQLGEEVEKRMADYMSRRSREFVTTIITKISVADLEIANTGVVPGSPLNQFSLDEYQQNLRIATTSNSSFGSGSVNDVYVLDSSLGQIGSVLDMGLTERIFAVRFLGDKGYVVTFRQIDPFYVLDLSNPQSPEMKGELKIPGFSAYLHPLGDDRILGVGREGSGVKLSIFNVSDPTNPTETENIIMQEFSSEVLNNHRAFLLDDKHKVFFMPAGNNGYIFNYANGLVQQLVVEGVNAQRALYINDFLYIVGNEIVVIDQNTWQEIARVEL